MSSFIVWKWGKPEFVGNKAKLRISKQVFQENEARQIFHRKNKCLFFGKFGGVLFSWNTRFEIRPFALLPTS